jgi:catecholate siderophore receptor
MQVIQVTGSRDAAPVYNPASASSATKLDVPLRDVPQTVNVVPEGLLRDQAAQSMKAVMKCVPGVGLSRMGTASVTR